MFFKLLTEMYEEDTIITRTRVFDWRKTIST